MRTCGRVTGAAALQSALDQSRWFYNGVRPHQNLSGLTPAEKWQGLTPVDLEQMPIRSVHEVRLLDGLLAGYWIRRYLRTSTGLGHRKYPVRRLRESRLGDNKNLHKK